MADFKEIRADEFQSSKFADTYRVRTTKKGIEFEFGKFEKNKEEITVVSSIIMKPKAFLDFILNGYGACLEYQKEFKTDLGLNTSNESK